MRDIAASEAAPSVTRVADANETAFSFATKKGSSLLDTVQSTALKTFLKRAKGYALDQMCLGFIGYEGPERHVKQQRKAVGRIVSKHGGLCIGSSPGELYDQKKFDTPYIRDFLLDRGVLADVSETSAPWSELAPLHAAVTGAARGAFADLGCRGWIMCHLSHSYHAGACLYFTFAVARRGGATGWRSTARSSRRSSRRSSTTAGRCRTTTPSAPSTPSGWSRTSPRPASGWCARCSTAPTPAPTSTRGRS